MIKFFRHIRQELINQNKVGNYFKYAIGEILLVVVGILIALQINNWNEANKENETASILAKSLSEDISKDITFLKSALNFSKLKIQNCDSLITLLSLPKKEWDIERIYKKVNIVGQSNPFFPTTGTYQQIVTSGSLKLFKQSIANQLNGYEMQLKKVRYWAEAEDKTLWLMGNIVWQGMNMQALSNIRFNYSDNNDMFMRLSKSSITEFINLISAIKTYRIKTEIEYKEQLMLAEDLISALKTLSKHGNKTNHLSSGIRFNLTHNF